MSGDGGFSFFLALLMVVVVSISAMTVEGQWRTVMKREREQQLLFRGEKIAAAIESYYKANSSGEGEYPRKLTDLLRDKRYPGVKRHLRKLYTDPMSPKGNWGMVYDQRGGIKGVYSKSGKQTLKKGGFPLKYKHFENKTRYSDWKFIYEKDDHADSTGSVVFACRQWV
ncbi:MAG: type II secretion system protein [Desulfobacteraceae bacterium]|nr:MAG: type II secretion system protein [Desulfobacteraceae bacterium]